MDAIFLFVIMVCLSRSAAVYDEKLLFSSYVHIPKWLARLLVSGHYPISKTKNPLENRQKLTVMSLMLYALILLCFLCCVINGRTLEPVEWMEVVSYSWRFTEISFYNSTEILNGRILATCFFFVVLCYAVNDFRLFIKPSYSDSKKGIVSIVLVCIIILALVICIIGGKNALVQWQKINGFST
ncbi:MAG: hypothetical protein IK019_09925 [Clostridia bacterium]|nr:hypothetical protein [Clostridia bacterium]